jgi:hypothetical protein
LSAADLFQTSLNFGCLSNWWYSRRLLVSWSSTGFARSFSRLLLATLAAMDSSGSSLACLSCTLADMESVDVSMYVERFSIGTAFGIPIFSFG